MDFECAAIQTMFYDYPVEIAVEQMYRNDDSFMDIFSDILRWRSSAFTVSEWHLLERILTDQWLGKELPYNTPHISRLLNLPNYVATQMLVMDISREPRVCFKNLFRWRTVTRMIGEDILTTAFVAYQDHESSEAMRAYPRELLIWNNVLPHDNARLNTILDNGMSDVHAHLYATADVFHVNWLSLMNTGRTDFHPTQFKHNADLQFVQPHTQTMYAFYSKCVAAAYLRQALYTQIIRRIQVDDSEWGKVKDILSDNLEAAKALTVLQGKVLNLQSSIDSISNPFGMIDYAIQPNHTILEHADNVNIFYQGERMLLYTFFRLWYEQDEQTIRIAHWFYLYLLLKINIRREYVETNSLHGFDNFAEIQRRKASYRQRRIHSIVAPLAAQTAMRPNILDDKLETRLTPFTEKGQLEEFIYTDYGKGVVSNNDNVYPNMDQRLSFVIHFIKDDDRSLSIEGSPRHATFVRQCFDDLSQILGIIESQNNPNSTASHPKIVGIDAAGSELKCRPEVFGHLFRYAYRSNLLGRTYHVGEDFYDLADGLRAIDEALLFLQLDSHSRLGHALALSVNARQYYMHRQYSTVISQQALLDNCVWLLYKAKQCNIAIPGTLELFLHDTAMTVFDSIGYDEMFDVLHYRHSMLLRSDNLSEAGVQSDAWKATAQLDADQARMARIDKVAVKLNEKYQKRKKVKENGAKVVIAHYPIQIVELITAIQTCMIRDIADKGIAIECCPSSNIAIGGFERYDQHPIFTFKPIEATLNTPIINVSINTDDAGIFATNISNEYSLITLAMMKMKDEEGHRLYNDDTIYDYIERVRQNGYLQRFNFNQPNKIAK